MSRLVQALAGWSCVILVVGMLHAAAPAAKETAPDGWTAGAPRDEIRPRFAHDPQGGPGGKPALAVIAHQREGQNGYWVKTFPVVGDRYYRFRVLRKTQGVAVPRIAVSERNDPVPVVLAAWSLPGPEDGDATPLVAVHNMP